MTLKSPVTERDIFVNPAITGYTRLFNDTSLINGAIAHARADELYRQSAMAFNSGDTSAAVDKFLEALSGRNELGNPAVIRLIKLKLASFGTLKRRIDELEEHARGEQSRFDELAREYTAMGVECMRGDELEAAVANFDKAISISPSYVPAHYGRARSMADAGDMDGAVDGFRRVLELDPRHFKAAYDLGDLYMQFGELYEALNMLLVALKIDDNDENLCHRLAELYDRIGDSDEAAAYRRKARRLSRRRLK